MVYTSRQLITDAYYISNIVALDVETVSGSQISRGLDRLNGAISSANFNTGLIPYFTTYEGNFIANEEKYYIPNLISVETLTYVIDEVRYSMEMLSRDMYFGAPRINNIKTLPCQWYLERLNNGANIYVYYLPQADYPFQITGKFQLLPVTLDTDLTLTYEQAYIEYLRYALAKLLCDMYQEEFPMQCMQELKKYEKSIKNVSHPDMTCQIVNVFPGAYNVPNYANANLARGWIPIRRG